MLFVSLSLTHHAYYNYISILCTVTKRAIFYSALTPRVQYLLSCLMFVSTKLILEADESN